MLPILIIKFGTASITDALGNLDEAIIKEVARQVASLQKNFRIVLVSSGAVGAGKKWIKNFKGELKQRKAAAAIGNPVLMEVYRKYFEKFDIPVAQSLCERGHFANRAQFLQLKETYETLWESGAIPIANENDVVSDVELKFSDNDELATLLAAGFGAETLMFSTSVGGLLDQNGQIVKQISKIDEQIWKLVDRSKSSLGLGGMLSKLSFAQRANQLGIKVIIFAARQENSILDALETKAGSHFEPEKVNMTLKQKWISTGSIIAGKVCVDAGAEAAIKGRKSLLAVGISNIEGEFEEGEVIELMNESKLCIAVGKAKVGSKILKDNLKTRKFEVAHADDIVIF
jgi:glutamate 5-kinase